MKSFEDGAQMTGLPSLSVFGFLYSAPSLVFAVSISQMKKVLPSNQKSGTFPFRPTTVLPAEERMASAMKDDIPTGASAQRAPALANRKTSASAKASSFLILQMITLLHPELNGGGDCSRRNAFQQ